MFLLNLEGMLVSVCRLELHLQVVPFIISFRKGLKNEEANLVLGAGVGASFRGVYVPGEDL